MKKIFAIFAALAFFALLLAGCESPVNNDNTNKTPTFPKMTIKNESSFTLSDITFSGISFSATGYSNELPPTTQAMQKLTANDVNKTGYITFVGKDLGIAFRVEEAISVGEDDILFTFTDNIVVRETGTDTRNTLGKVLNRLRTPPKPELTAGDESIRAVWSAVDAATLYRVYVAQTDTPPSEWKTTVTQPSADIAGLVNEETYYVWVQAVNTKAESDLSPPSHIIISPSYTVTYTLNGGTNNSANPSSYTVHTPTVTLEAPTRTGFAFGGWYENADFSGSPKTGIAQGSSGHHLCTRNGKLSPIRLPIS